MAKTLDRKVKTKLSPEEIEFLSAGLGQPGGKLPLFDFNGQKIEPRIIESCLAKGLAERWFTNPMKPDWLVCRLTEAGQNAVSN